MDGRALRVVVGLFACLTFGLARGEGATPPPVTRVTYVSGASYYIDAGRARGLREGDALTVVRDGRTVATLIVEHLSATRASCRLAASESEPLVGDEVRVPIVETLPSTPQPAAADDGPPIGLGRVSHIDGATVFIDSGSDRGVRTGDQLAVVRGASTLAVLEVSDVSADRAACTILDGGGSVGVGDFVRLPILGTGDGEGPIAVHEGGVTVYLIRPAAGEETVRDGREVRGRIGVRYLTVRDHVTGAGDVSQPSLDARVDADELGGGRLDFNLDARSRRTYRPETTGDGEVEDSTRVYRLSASAHDPESRYRVTLGRQYSPELSSVSTFDGLLFDYTGARWSSGLFAGTQPDVEDFGYSDEVREYGTYVQIHDRRTGSPQWSVTGGAVGSYHLGEINREFVFLQALFTGRRLTFYASQEVDYNRDWKLEAGEEPISWTSSYGHLSYRVGRSLTLRGGYDNRRNVRLYRDLITPETDFDDSFRTGGWVGLTQRIGRRLRIGVDAKRNTGGDAGAATSYTLFAGANGITAANLSFYYRGTRFENETLEGFLHTLSAGVAIGRRARVLVTGGLREDTALVATASDGELVWYGLELDYDIGRHWYVQMSGEHSDGPALDTDQGYFGMTYRF